MDRAGAAGPADVALVGTEKEVISALEDLAEAGANELLAVESACGHLSQEPARDEAVPLGSRLATGQQLVAPGLGQILERGRTSFSVPTSATSAGPAAPARSMEARRRGVLYP